MSALQHLNRPRSEWNLFLRAYVLVWGIRIALWVIPFQKLYPWTEKYRKGRIGDRPLDKRTAYAVVWAVSAAARRVPRATCLTQALATQIMLGRRGHITTLQLGVKKTKDGKFDAHAWIERNGEVVIGFNDNFHEITRLPALPGEIR